jgi:hypothetical protein
MHRTRSVVGPGVHSERWTGSIAAESHEVSVIAATA